MYARLAAEIDRIVDSPYPTQLKSLRDLVCSADCTDADISKCGALRQCRIDRLASLLLEGLRQWPYVLDVVTRLAYNSFVRDALLRYAPTLINDVIAEATKAGDVHPRYGAAAVALLSHPLPAGVTLPSAVQTLLLRLVDRAANQPSASAIKPIYLILTGTSTLLLGALSSELLARFEDQLMAVLRSSTLRSSQETQEHCLTLYCLAIMRIVSTTIGQQELQLTSEPSSWNTQDLLASTQPPISTTWSADAMREFFTHSSKAPKTLQLLVLRVLDALRITNDYPINELLEVVSLANEIISAIPAELRSSWTSTNVMAVQRLQQKAIVDQVDSQLRVLALGFLMQLCDSGPLLPSTVEHSQRLLTSPVVFLGMGSCTDSRAALCRLSNAICLRSPESVPQILHNTIDFIAEAPAVDLVAGAESLDTILESLASLASESPAILEAIASMLGSQSTNRQLEALASTVDSTDIDHAPEKGAMMVCSALVLTKRRAIVHAIAGTFLSCALDNHSSERRLSRRTTAVLVRLHTASAREGERCHINLPSAAGLVNQFARDHENGTPPYPQGEWRAAPNEHFRSKAENERDNVTNIFMQACADLEARCRDVEQPLRAEEARYAELKDQYLQLSYAYSELETQHIDDRLRLETVEAERDTCLGELDASRERTDDLIARIGAAEQRLKACQTKADEDLAETKRAREITQLQHDTTLAKMEEDLDETQQNLKRMQDEQSQTVVSLNAARQDLEAAQTFGNELKAETGHLQAALDTERSKGQGLEHALRSANEKMDGLSTELATTKSQADKDREAYNNHLEQVKAHAKACMDDTHASHNKSFDRLAAQHGEEIAALDRQLADLRNDSTMTAEQHSLDLAKNEETLLDMQQQLERLHKRCKQKDQQIAEANALRSNLMNAMGLGGLQAGLRASMQSSLPHRSRPSSARTQTEPNTTPPTPTSADGQSEDHADRRQSHFGASTRSQNGSTPKRPKPRKSFKVPSPARARTDLRSQGARVSDRGRASAGRQPLLNVSVNRSPRKSSEAKSLTGKYGAENDEFEVADGSMFEGSEVFAGTPDRGRAGAETEDMLDDVTETGL